MLKAFCFVLFLIISVFDLPVYGPLWTFLEATLEATLLIHLDHHAIFLR